MEIASRVDRKEITPEQGALEYAKAVAQATTEGQSRSLANQIGGGIRGERRAAAAAAAIAATLPVSCSKLGNTMTRFETPRAGVVPRLSFTQRRTSTLL